MADTDARHGDAVGWLGEARRSQTSADPVHLVTHNYVVIEAAALLSRRIGADAVRDFLLEMLPGMSVHFVDPGTHEAAASAYLGSLSRRSSLVDFVSFEVMRDQGISSAFAFDRDFERHGFDVVP